MLTPIGEVIYTSTTEITVQSQADVGPFCYGSLIRVGHESPCVGVIFNMETTSLDPHRRPMALGLPPGELEQTYPQFRHLLKNQFQALLIGQLLDSAFRYGLPAQPPRIHDHVRPCSQDEIQAISLEPGFLRLLQNSAKSVEEELLVSVCRTMIEAHQHDRRELVRIGKALSTIFHDNYDSLRRILTRLETT
jgi:hypothetical protein